jgi:hypothetical protein
MTTIKFTLTGILTIMLSQAVAQDAPKLTEVWQPVPPTVSPGQEDRLPPADAEILFDGKHLHQWIHDKGNQPASWTVSDGTFTVKPGSGSIRTGKSYGSCQLHVEWRTPGVIKGEGQARGNSGILLMSRYELQIMDSYNNPTYSNGQAGSIFKQHMPLVNVCRPPGEWQSFDILFTSPQFYADGRVKEPARITVFQNGVLIQNNVAIWGPVTYTGIPKYALHSSKEPLLLQDHGELVSFRNIWIREL